MSGPTRPRPLPVLSDVVDVLDEAIDAGHSDRSIVVRIRRPGGDVELGLRTLDPGVHPVDALLGFRAPPDWHAIGVVSPGRAHDLGGSRPPTAVRLIHIVERSGESASCVRPLDDFALPRPVGTPGGFLDDCCRRVLGLPTAPPPCDPVAWWAAIWLERVLESALGEPGRHWCWSDLARRHPLVSKGAVPTQPEALASQVRTLAASRGWASLRHAASKEPTVGDLTPAICRWMDDGLFARWALAGTPDASDLLGELGALLPPDQVDALAATLAAWDRP